MQESYVTICGGTRLEGEINVQGSKNTALPVMAACLLTDGCTVLYDCPKIGDVEAMALILKQIGCKVSWIGSHLMIDSSGTIDSVIPKGGAGMLRGSSLLMGALLGRNGRVVLEEPGGCRIGSRPLNYHFLGFEKMGISVCKKGCRYECFCDNIKGTVIDLPYPSVGATENLMMAASKAEGVTIIRGCALEPEIRDLAEFLIHMGVSIDGIGTPVLKIQGRKKLNASHYRLPFDRIAAATYLTGAMITGGDVTLRLSCDWKRMGSSMELFEKMGAEIHKMDGKVRLLMRRPVRAVNVETGPYPGIPTDIQPFVLVSMTQAQELSVLYENVFNARFQVCNELNKMGARIEIEKNCARVLPVKRLKGSYVSAPDLRGGAALILAALTAEGETRLGSFSCVERGYDDIVGHLNLLGAAITKNI